MPIDKDLLALLVCPADRAQLREEGDVLVCVSCRRRYPVRESIPVLLIEEGSPPE